jgi:hypothetical protein
MVLAMCSSRSSEDGIPRPPDPQALVKGGVRREPFDPALAPIDTAALRAKKAPPAASAKVLRVEDLPSASPVAMRPLRVDELPVSPAKGRRRGKGGASSEGAAASVRRIEDLPAISDAVRPLRPEEVTPDLVKRADDMLWNHSAPVGTDIPFEVGGKNYVARFAIHYHEFGGTKKPWGYHKGVTLYSTER